MARAAENAAADISTSPICALSNDDHQNNQKDNTANNHDRDNNSGSIHSSICVAIISTDINDIVVGIAVVIVGGTVVRINSY